MGQHEENEVVVGVNFSDAGAKKNKYLDYF